MLGRLRPVLSAAVAAGVGRLLSAVVGSLLSAVSRAVGLVVVRGRLLPVVSRAAGLVALVGRLLAVSMLVLSISAPLGTATFSCGRPPSLHWTWDTTCSKTAARASADTTCMTQAPHHDRGPSGFQVPQSFPTRQPSQHHKCRQSLQEGRAATRSCYEELLRARAGQLEHHNC